MTTVDFSETIAACDLKVGRCRQLIQIMKVCESLQYIYQVLYVLCFTRPQYQVSVYRTIGPLVLNFFHNFVEYLTERNAYNLLYYGQL